MSSEEEPAKYNQQSSRREAPLPGHYISVIKRSEFPVDYISGEGVPLCVHGFREGKRQTQLSAMSPGPLEAEHWSRGASGSYVERL